MINFIYDIYNNNLKFITFLITQLLIILFIFYQYNIFNISSKFPILVISIILIIQFIVFLSYHFFKIITPHTTTPPNNIFSKPEKDIKTYEEYFKYIKLLSLLFILPFSSILLTFLLLYIITNVSYVKYIVENVVKYSIYIAILYFIYSSKDKIIDFIKHNINVKTFTLAMIDEYNQYTLLVILILLIINMFLPYLFRKITSYNGTVLIDKPVYLNQKYVRGDKDILYKTKPRNYNYSLSLWFWLNPQPSNTSYAYQKYTNILTFDKKPAIDYNGSNNTLRILFDNTDKEHTIFSTKNVLYQKWNNVVINYTEGNVDVFLNGELTGSKPNIAPFYNYTFIDIGEKNGLNGGISNVVYYQEPLTLSGIKFNYNSFKHLDEPYI